VVDKTGTERRLGSRSDTVRVAADPQTTDTGTFRSAAAAAPYTGVMFRRQFRGAAYHRRQHRIMLALALIGVLIVVLGIVSRSGEAVGAGLTWAVLFGLGGLHRHDWEAMDRRAENRHPRR
jgi:hypothetical protein